MRACMLFQVRLHPGIGARPRKNRTPTCPIPVAMSAELKRRALVVAQSPPHAVSGWVLKTREGYAVSRVLLLRVALQSLTNMGAGKVWVCWAWERKVRV